MKRNLISLVTTIFVLTVGALAQGAKTDYGKPVVVLVERNPWLMVIGSDAPTFVLYETGHAIYKRTDDKQVKVYQVKLDHDATKKLIDNLGLSNGFYNLPEYIRASSATDQPTNSIFVNLQKRKEVTVYGNLRRNIAGVDTPPPAAFLRVYATLANFSHPAETKWQPQTLEVMLWDYSYAPNSIDWPKEFPDLKAATTVRRGDSYSVFLESSQFEAFEKFYQSIGKKTAVKINGKKMAVSYRFPFP